MLKQIYRWFCYIGIHRYDIIDTKYGFGAAGSTETVKCKDCGIAKIRQKKINQHHLSAVFLNQKGLYKIYGKKNLYKNNFL